MFDYLMLAYHLVREAVADNKVREFFKHQVFRNRIVVPVEMDLIDSLPKRSTADNGNIHFIELKLEDLSVDKWKFPVQSRRVKASRNLKRGLRGFALAQETTIVGDLWCLCRKSKQGQVTHPDFRMLDIVCEENAAYAFDMYIRSTYRGKNLAVLLQRSLHQTLKDEGYVKVYGAYYEDNLPALWMHRMLKFKEHPKRRVFRFFFYLKSALLTSANAPLSLANTTQKGD